MMDVTTEVALTWPTVSHVCAVYGIPAPTLYTALQSGRLPHVKIGEGRRAVYLLDPAGVTAYVATYVARGDKD